MVRRRCDLSATGLAPDGTTPARTRRAPSRARATGPMFERPDWTAFRSVEGLCRRAGATADRLGEVVVKELVDNALDAGNCQVFIEDGVVVVLDDGPGIEGSDTRIAAYYSISREMMSSKYLRRPTRGALGNGLRVVVGAVVATGGKLFVSTRRRRLQIITDPVTGKSRAVRVGGYDGPGTRIEIELGKPLVLKGADLVLGDVAIAAAQADGTRYCGSTSPHWYGPDSFHDLLTSVTPDSMTVREFLGNFDGCSAKAGEIAGEFLGCSVKSLSRAESGRLLDRAKSFARVVNPSRLGALGGNAFSGAYAKSEGFVSLPRSADGSTVRLPAVIEVWAAPDPEGSQAVFLVNGTPCIRRTDATYVPGSKSTIVSGHGFKAVLKTGKSGMWFHVNVIIPFMPTTSEGKDPALGIVTGLLSKTMEKAAKRQKAASQR